MKLTDQIIADKEQFMKVMADYPKDKPVTMINILKFKEKTGRGEETGAEAYKIYSKNVAPLVQKAGAEVVWAGNVDQTIIGDYTDQPHMFLIVRYPNITAFIQMATSPAYQKVKHDREIALEYGGLIASTGIKGLG